MAGHIHHRIEPGPDHEAVGSGDALAVQQGVDGQGITVFGRLFDPELPEFGKFFGLGQSRVQCQPPRRQSVHLPHPDDAEITGSQEDGDFIGNFILAQEIMEPQSRETQIGRQWLLKLVLAVIEEFRRVGQGRGNAVFDDVDVHPVLEDETAVEGLHLKREPLVAP